MVQFGCPYSKDPKHPRAGTGGGPKGNIKDEHTAKIRNEPGTLSMANAGPNSGSSQFFINTVDNSFLNWWEPPFESKHPVFGKVTQGLDVVEKISKVKRDPTDRPVVPVKMIKVTVNAA